MIGTQKGTIILTTTHIRFIIMLHSTLQGEGIVVGMLWALTLRWSIRQESVVGLGWSVWVSGPKPKPLHPKP